MKLLPITCPFQASNSISLQRIGDLKSPPRVPDTVNSRYSGHPRDHDLVSVIARVRNSGVREDFYFKPNLQKGVTCVFIFINSSTFFRPAARKERQNFIYKQNRT